MNLKKLREPFFPDELEWRPMSVGKKGDKFWVRALAYVTNRAIMDRLDEVCGPENWRNEFCKAPDGGILCGLSIKVGDEWVTKWDGSENTDIEAVKGGLSGAMKRAGVQWGIGRYLYDLEENFGDVMQGGIFSAKTKEGDWFNWNPPKLPAWAIPGTNQTKSRGVTPPQGDPEHTAAKPSSDRRKAVIDLITGKQAELTPDQLADLKADLRTAGDDETSLDLIEGKVNRFIAGKEIPF